MTVITEKSLATEVCDTYHDKIMFVGDEKKKDHYFFGEIFDGIQ